MTLSYCGIRVKIIRSLALRTIATLMLTLSTNMVGLILLMAFLSTGFGIRMELNGRATNMSLKLNGHIDLANFDQNMTIVDMMAKLSNLTATLEELSAKLQKNVAGETIPPCPAGWDHWKDLCYLLVSHELLMWEAAIMRCHDRGGILAEPDTEEAMTHVFSLVGLNTTNNAWIGATDGQTEGTWFWVDSKKSVSFFKWENGQPNNSGGKQNCMEIYQGHLNDENCNSKSQFVCQRNEHQP